MQHRRLPFFLFKLYTICFSFSYLSTTGCAAVVICFEPVDLAPSFSSFPSIQHHVHQGYAGGELEVPACDVIITTR